MRLQIIAKKSVQCLLSYNKQYFLNKKFDRIGTLKVHVNIPRRSVVRVTTTGLLLCVCTRMSTVSLVFEVTLRDRQTDKIEKHTRE